MIRRLLGDRGAALIEFALASIVFFLTIFGTFSFGLAIWQYNVVASAAKEGARWAAVRAATASDSDVRTYVLSRTFGLSSTVTTTWPVKTPGQIVTVRVQQTFTPLTAFVPQATITLSSSAGMVIMH